MGCYPIIVKSKKKKHCCKRRTKFHFNCMKILDLNSRRNTFNPGK